MNVTLDLLACRAQRNEAEGRCEALSSALRDSAARERALRNLNGDLLERQSTRSLEFDHRFFNGLQSIISVLALQAKAGDPHVAASLDIAAARIAAFGNIHRLLQAIDPVRSIEVKPYLESLCKELTQLLFHDRTSMVLRVEGSNCTASPGHAMPLGFIVHELVTNSAKYGEGDITVQLAQEYPNHYSVSVTDQGVGMPAGLSLTNRKGLGMKIVLALVKEIGATFAITPTKSGYGTCSTVTICNACGVVSEVLVNSQELEVARFA
jgi:two-component system, sensor histidine kinase PdtaS